MVRRFTGTSAISGGLAALMKTSATSPNTSRSRSTKAEYLGMAWNDFTRNQIVPFGEIPFYLGIGNHETIRPKDHAAFVAQFRASSICPTCARSACSTIQPIFSRSRTTTGSSTAWISSISTTRPRISLTRISLPGLKNAPLRFGEHADSHHRRGNARGAAGKHFEGPQHGSIQGWNGNRPSCLCGPSERREQRRQARVRIWPATRTIS